METREVDSTHPFVHGSTIFKRDFSRSSSSWIWNEAHWNRGMRPTILRNGLLGMKNGEVGLSVEGVPATSGAVGGAKGDGLDFLCLLLGELVREEGEEEEEGVPGSSVSLCVGLSLPTGSSFARHTVGVSDL